MFDAVTALVHMAHKAIGQAGVRIAIRTGLPMFGGVVEIPVR